jgi:hypothetical protein
MRTMGMVKYAILLFCNNTWIFVQSPLYLTYWMTSKPCDVRRLGWSLCIRATVIDLHGCVECSWTWEV